MTTRAYFSDSISAFLDDATDSILGRLVQSCSFSVESTQRDAWLSQIEILKCALVPYRTSGSIYFEYNVPRLGKRIDVVVLLGPVLFVIEFKVGDQQFSAHAIDQVYDYALDLKNFHDTSHTVHIAPVLVATRAKPAPLNIRLGQHGDRMLEPICSAVECLPDVFAETLKAVSAPMIDRSVWEGGRYCPTPTIIEAAAALYGGHSVEDISRNDAGATNLSTTAAIVTELIKTSRAESKKVICFVTGVPGAGKTLVGLDIATKHFEKNSDLYSVFLSGNGPLVSVLCEALARDSVLRNKERGVRLKKKRARSEVQAFIQNVHHFRDDCLVDSSRAPIEHVALFDEAQRAWNLDMTAKFMRQKKGFANFQQSEPEFLISCLDRHQDWAVIVCLVGGGQEINTGEAGIGEWIESVRRAYPHWHLQLSSRLSDSEYGAGKLIESVRTHPRVIFQDELHLGVSMRSFRAEHMSLLVKQLLDLQPELARETLQQVTSTYPIVMTRRVETAKQWLREKARGNERYGLVVSSQAQRLRPHAIDVRAKLNPIHWFLHGKDDVRSSFYLEDAATEFHVQGLELDWAGVVWDGDLRYSPNGWHHFEFKGKKWNRIQKNVRQAYLKNAYRVLLTRARQGMVVVVPEGDAKDHTRDPRYYDDTFGYLAGLGIKLI
jgi:hypothetical protein